MAVLLPASVVSQTGVQDTDWSLIGAEGGEDAADVIRTGIDDERYFLWMFTTPSNLILGMDSPAEDPGVNTGHKITIRFYMSGAGPDEFEGGSLRVGLYVEGTGFIAEYEVPVEEWEHNTWVEYEIEVPEEDVETWRGLDGYDEPVVGIIREEDGPDFFLTGISKLTLTIPGSSTSDSISPSEGPITGGTEVTITASGGNFDTNPVVSFGGEPATHVVVTSPTELTCRTPAHFPAETVDVQAGDQLFEDGFTYTEPAPYVFPVITSIDPEEGPVVGNTFVTITGENFMPGMLIYFDGLLASDITYVSDTTYTCVTPPHEIGQVVVTMTGAPGIPVEGGGD